MINISKWSVSRCLSMRWGSNVRRGQKIPMKKGDNCMRKEFITFMLIWRDVEFSFRFRLRIQLAPIFRTSWRATNPHYLTVNISAFYRDSAPEFQDKVICERSLFARSKGWLLIHPIALRLWLLHPLISSHGDTIITSFSPSNDNEI